MEKKTSNILVGVDFSDSSDRALSYALQLAEQLSARLDLVYVYDIPVVAMPELVLPSTTDVSQMAEFRKQLKDLRARVVGNRVPSRIHLRVGDPVTGMLEVIDELKPDLVVVGSHGRGAVMRALMGSVSERLLRRSTVPVLVIPAAGRAAAAQEEVEQAMERAKEAPEIAWSCARCGHIRKSSEAVDRCSRCGLEPASWNSAPLSAGPADALEPAVGENEEERVDPSRASDPGILFATSPPGTSGYSVNPELRVRY